MAIITPEQVAAMTLAQIEAEWNHSIDRAFELRARLEEEDAVWATINAELVRRTGFPKRRESTPPQGTWPGGIEPMHEGLRRGGA